MSVLGVNIGVQNTPQNKEIESHLVELFQSLTPLVLETADNVVSSLEKSGQLREHIGKAIDTLSEGSVGAAVILPAGGRTVALEFATPELIHKITQNLHHLIDKNFIEEFLARFKSELKKQGKNPDQNPEDLMKKFFSACITWFTQDVNQRKSLSDFLAKDKDLVSALEIVRSTLINLILDLHEKNQLGTLIRKIIPGEYSHISFAVANYVDNIIKPEALKSFSNDLFIALFKAIVNPTIKKVEVKNPEQPTLAQKGISAVFKGASLVKSGAAAVIGLFYSPQPKINSEEKSVPKINPQQLQATFVQTTMLFKPLVVSAIKDAITEENLPQLRRNALGLIGINFTPPIYFNSKSEIVKLIDKFANRLDKKLLENILNEIPLEKRVRFLNLAQQLFGNTVSNALNAHYNSGIVNRIHAQEFITEILDTIRKLKPKDLSGILSVAFSNPIERKAALFFLKHLADHRILMNIIENAATELNKILDPELGGFLQQLKTFNNHWHAGNQGKKTLSTWTRIRLVEEFEKLSNGAAEACRNIDHRIENIDKEIAENLQPKSPQESKKASLENTTPETLIHNMATLYKAKDELIHIKAEIQPLCDLKKKEIIKHTILQGHKLQLKQLSAKLKKIEYKLEAFIKKTSGNTWVEKIQAWFMDESRAQEFLNAKRSHRGDDLHVTHADNLHQAVIDAQMKLSELHKPQNQKSMNSIAISYNSAMNNLFSGACGMQRSKSKELDKMATEISDLLRPVMKK